MSKGSRDLRIRVNRAVLTLSAALVPSAWGTQAKSRRGEAPLADSLGPTMRTRLPAQRPRSAPVGHQEADSLMSSFCSPKCGSQSGSSESLATGGSCCAAVTGGDLVYLAAVARLWESGDQAEIACREWITQHLDNLNRVQGACPVGVEQKHLIGGSIDELRMGRCRGSFKI